MGAAAELQREVVPFRQPRGPDGRPPRDGRPPPQRVEARRHAGVYPLSCCAVPQRLLSPSPTPPPSPPSRYHIRILRVVNAPLVLLCATSRTGGGEVGCSRVRYL